MTDSPQSGDGGVRLVERWVRVELVGGEPIKATYHAIVWQKGYEGLLADWCCSHAHRSGDAATRCAKRKEAARD